MAVSQTAESKTASFPAKRQTTQRSILLSTKQKEDRNHGKLKMDNQSSYGNTGLNIQIFVSKGFCIVNTNQIPTLKIFTKGFYGGRVPHVLELLHDSPSVGHFGIEKKYQRAYEKFYWPCMRKDVRNWIQNCDVCLKRKRTKQKHWNLIKKGKSSHLFWQVSLDIMGPLPESQGNKYILLNGDQLSKWQEAVILANPEAKTVSRAFVEDWIVKFDCPVNLHGDQGLKTMSKLW